MNKVYLIIVHKNTIEEDYVNIIKSSNNINKLIDTYNEIVNKYKHKYKHILNINYYNKFTNNDNTYLIEVYIEKVTLI